ncbi:acyl carrier protein [Actinokineospora sp. HUAS TT18]|uniref:acyl carrier protein n=1 Tax=Actinokineospora sp. HUAS TT18 TaxID=3447451 RepID=UPI003F51CA21
MTEDLRTRLRAVLAARLGEGFAAVPDDADLRDALGDGYDSLTAMECITAVEEEFGLEVDLVGDDIRHWFSSVDRMHVFVTDRLEDAAVLGGRR